MRKKTAAREEQERADGEADGEAEAAEEAAAAEAAVWFGDWGLGRKV